MAFGDIGGVVTELIITCRTAAEGAVNIAKGDAVKLAGPYTVTNEAAADDPVFGEALAASRANGEAIPVKVRGISVFAYEGDPDPAVDGVSGVAAAETPGKVKAPAAGNGRGVIVKVDAARQQVHVLL